MLAGLELREVRSFLAVAEERHFGRAAERLGVSSSRVSQTVRQLEARVGVELFQRTSRRVALTAAGAQLYQGVHEPIAQLDAAFAAAHRDATGVAGTLRLGMFSPLNGGPWLLDIIAAFHAAHRSCTVVTINTTGDRTQAEWLRCGRVDMLALRLPFTAPDITIGPMLSREPRILLVADSDPLARRDAIDHDDLARRRVAYAPGLDDQLRDAFFPLQTPSGARLEPVPIADVSEIPVRVALGDFAHMTVPSFLERYRFDRVTAIPIRDLPPSETALAWVTKTQGPKHAAFAATARSIAAARLDTPRSSAATTP